MVFSSIVEEECESYPGYRSHYNPDAVPYIRKDFRLWDHNELTWLAMAAAEICGGEWDELEEELEALLEDNSIPSAGPAPIGLDRHDDHYGFP